ncbi:MAG TPA: glycerol-3-phosphate 1-O-acyltransferase PlsY [Terriglobales bacterium]|nr:glycerol-3-phosphate 1-O-acyltransferase PlsY [Terriglobales bacterium]
MTILLTITLSYLLGSVPFGYLLVHRFRGADIRESGSGNIGATNVARTSPALGIATLLLDATKGFVSVALVRYLITPRSPVQPAVLSALAALCAILGHIFPVWLRFRGGKGVATGLGSFVLIAPKSILVMIAAFAGIFLAFRYVSLASVMVVALLPVLAWGFDRDHLTPAVLIFMILASVLIVLKHHDNIRRLLAGTENRFSLRRG